MQAPNCLAFTTAPRLARIRNNLLGGSLARSLNPMPWNSSHMPTTNLSFTASTQLRFVLICSSLCSGTCRRRCLDTQPATRKLPGVEQPRHALSSLAVPNRICRSCAVHTSTLHPAELSKSAAQSARLSYWLPVLLAERYMFQGISLAARCPLHPPVGCA